LALYAPSPTTITHEECQVKLAMPAVGCRRPDIDLPVLEPLALDVTHAARMTGCDLKISTVASGALALELRMISLLMVLSR
jgi:hypothetical protein